MVRQTESKQDMMHSIAAVIIRSRYMIVLLFLAAAVYCALSLSRVKVSSDLTAFLPETTETRRGITVMEEEFTTYAGENVMIGNVTAERAKALADAIQALDGVLTVSFDDTAATIPTPPPC